MAHGKGQSQHDAGNEPENHEVQSAGMILLVEPDRATRKLYGRTLGRFWQVVEVQSAAAARLRLGDPTLAAVVIEPFEGTLDEGWALLRSVRHSSNGAQIPVIVCSVVDERRAAYALGATSYLLKPVSPQQLIHELQRSLGPSPSLDKE